VPAGQRGVVGAEGVRNLALPLLALSRSSLTLAAEVCQALVLQANRTVR
jgi:hypothetical protein